MTTQNTKNEDTSHLVTAGSKSINQNDASGAAENTTSGFDDWGENDNNPPRKRKIDQDADDVDQDYKIDEEAIKRRCLDNAEHLQRLENHNPIQSSKFHNFYPNFEANSNWSANEPNFGGPDTADSDKFNKPFNNNNNNARPTTGPKQEYHNKQFNGRPNHRQDLDSDTGNGWGDSFGSNNKNQNTYNSNDKEREKQNVQDFKSDNFKTDDFPKPKFGLRRQDSGPQSNQSNKWSPGGTGGSGTGGQPRQQQQDFNGRGRGRFQNGSNASGRGNGGRGARGGGRGNGRNNNNYEQGGNNGREDWKSGNREKNGHDSRNNNNNDHWKPNNNQYQGAGGSRKENTDPKNSVQQNFDW